MPKWIIIILAGLLVFYSGCSGRKANNVKPVHSETDKTLLNQVEDRLSESQAYTSKQVSLLVELESLKMQWKAAFDYSGQDKQSVEETLKAKTSENFDFLLGAANGTEPVGKKIASAVLGFSGNKNALPVLLNNLYFPSSSVKANSAISIGILSDKDTSIAILLDLMTADPDADVRNACAFAVYKIVQSGNDRGSFEALLKALDDPDEGVRNQAVRALMKIGNKEAALPLLEKTLADPVPTVSDNTILALQTLECYDPIIELLIANLESPDFRLKSNSMRILKLLAQIDLGDDQIAWRKWWEHNKEQFLKARETKQH